jgi:GNAT superfamily N-acetyltransferase
MSVAACEVRLARADEIDELVSIDIDAGALFASMGMNFSALTPEHPYVRKERAQWIAAAQRGWVFIAIDDGPDAAGFLAMDLMDQEPYVEQLSIRTRAMRRGFGTMFIHHALAWAAERGGALWLTTYAHVPWNRRYYERFGFEVVPETRCGSEMQACLAEQRGALPVPEQRIAMCHAAPSRAADCESTASKARNSS